MKELSYYRTFIDTVLFLRKKIRADRRTENELENCNHADKTNFRIQSLLLIPYL